MAEVTLVKGTKTLVIPPKAWKQFISLPSSGEAFAYNLDLVNAQAPKALQNFNFVYRYAMVVTMMGYLGLTPFVFATGGEAAAKMCKNYGFTPRARGTPLKHLKISLRLSKQMKDQNWQASRFKLSSMKQLLSSTGLRLWLTEIDTPQGKGTSRMEACKENQNRNRSDYCIGLTGGITRRDHEDSDSH